MGRLSKHKLKVWLRRHEFGGAIHYFCCSGRMGALLGVQHSITARCWYMCTALYHSNSAGPCQSPPSALHHSLVSFYYHSLGDGQRQKSGILSTPFLGMTVPLRCNIVTCSSENFTRQPDYLIALGHLWLPGSINPGAINRSKAPLQAKAREGNKDC